QVHVRQSIEHQPTPTTDSFGEKLYKLIDFFSSPGFCIFSHSTSSSLICVIGKDLKHLTRGRGSFVGSLEYEPRELCVGYHMGAPYRLAVLVTHTVLPFHCAGLPYLPTKFSQLSTLSHTVKVVVEKREMGPSFVLHIPIRSHPPHYRVCHFSSSLEI
ncbi:unnamed protein product, partial [Ixodes pacificus]